MTYRIVPFAVHFFRGYGSKKNCKKSFVHFLLITPQKSQFFIGKIFTFFFMPIGGKTCTASLRFLGLNLL